jgi:hypothetical protein
MRLEGRSEDVVEEVDETATTPPVSVQWQVGSAGRLADVLGDVRDEVGIGLAKAVDRLFRIADPHAGAGEARHGDEDGKLERVGVLEFVDEHGLEALAKVLFELRLAEV